MLSPCLVLSCSNSVTSWCWAWSTVTSLQNHLQSPTANTQQCEGSCVSSSESCQQVDLAPLCKAFWETPAGEVGLSCYPNCLLMDSWWGGRHLLGVCVCWCWREAIPLLSTPNKRRAPPKFTEGAWTVPLSTRMGAGAHFISSAQAPSLLGCAEEVACITFLGLAGLQSTLGSSCCSAVQSCPSDSLRPHGLQHTRPLCPSPTPGACSNSCPSNRWCHPTLSSSVIPFSSCLQSFPASGSFPMSQLFASGGQSIGASASASVLPMNI